ncbi:MAG: recombinase family protein, partial [Janthinobacterium lividum]
MYTRKSHSEGLEQPFNSLDAQRSACSHFIASQLSEGWHELEGCFDDGGFSGGSLERPALARLMEYVESGAVDTVVVYKIDRLSRSLRDFVRLMEVFERRAVTFVSVTQQFSTTTSMGRLTLNVLLSFAQFEREITSERTRDKFSALRERGAWTTGFRPYGYQLVDRQLVVDAAEAAVVQRVYALYARLRSAIPIAGLLNANGLRTHRGTPFNYSFVRRILENRLYRGERAYLGQPYPGTHRAIISERVWARTEAVKDSSVARRGQRQSPLVGILTGLVHIRGQPLLNIGSRTKGRLYRYYEPAGRPRPTNGERVE